MKLLLGTSNKGKIGEYKWIFSCRKDIELLTPEDLGINDNPEETSETFEENALMKAKFYCEKTGLPALGDDAGIEIDALGGEPGVKSRRWLGHVCTDRELINHTLKMLSGIPREKRGAQFTVAVAAAFPDGRTQTSIAGQHGYITEKVVLKLIPGYPFRSIFERTKNEYSDPSYIWNDHYSHRKAAMEKLWQVLRPCAKVKKK